MIRAALRAALVLGLMMGALVAPAMSSTENTAQAANLQFFDPGNIISDAVFFDALSMDGPGIQTFLNAKGTRCVAGEMACLKNYRQDTQALPANELCSTFGSSVQESAASIIARAAVACGVNPKVLLVLLQKEQGMVTGSQLTAKKYTRAAGYKCPDTAPCDPKYAGFQNQVYWSAWQYRNYAAYPLSFNYRAGQSNKIKFHPDAACGTSEVWIANQATAGLYNYTPYRPNQAALDAGSGTGDSCSAYGNRNFWIYFTDWFGSTQSPGGSAMLAKYTDSGGASGPLGAQTSGILCGLVGGGCYQVFTAGSIYWTGGTGAAMVLPGPVRERWAAGGVEIGFLGYPTSDTVCGLVGGGCYQQFQGGSVYSSTASSAAFFIRGGVRDAWSQTDREYGALGYPTSDENCGLTRSGCRQSFVNGLIYWSPATGAQAISGAIRDRYNTLGSETSALGYPITGAACGLADGGCYQQFELGKIYVSNSTAARAVWGSFRDRWDATGLENGSLGYPTSDENCGLTRSGCRQSFVNGLIYWSPATGAQAISGAIRDRYSTLGSETSGLGYPTSSTTCGLADGGCSQQFQGGSIYVSNSSPARTVLGGIRDEWQTTGLEKGPLGYPTSDENCSVAGCVQSFQGASVVWTPAKGTYVMSGGVLASWSARGGLSAAVGAPVADSACGLREGGCWGQFLRGTIYWSPTSDAHQVWGGMREAWNALALENGPLGYPTTDEAGGLVRGGAYQEFQGGSVYWSPQTGGHAVQGAVFAEWTQRARENGSLGYPIGDGTTTGTVTTQTFQGGRISVDSATGTVIVR